jgi:hypothetical protein
MHRDTCQFFKTCNVDFRQNLDESWTDVSSPFLIINKVLSMIRNKLQGTKNKSLYHKEKNVTNPYIKYLGIN